jgi:hypothetical protein
MFSSPNSADGLWDPSSLQSIGYRESFPGGKVAGTGSWSSSPSSAKVKNDWSYISSPPIGLRGLQRETLPFARYYECDQIKEDDVQDM